MTSDTKALRGLRSARREETRTAPETRKARVRRRARKTWDAGFLEGWQDAIARERWVRDQVSKTQFGTWEAVLAEWLFSDDDGGIAVPTTGSSTVSPSFSEVLARFKHGLSGASDEALAKLRGLVRGLLEALWSNDRTALNQACQFWAEHVGVANSSDRLRRELQIVESAVAGAVPREFVTFLLGAVEPEFRKLTAQEVDRVLSAVKSTAVNTRAKGGKGNLSTRGALHKLRRAAKLPDMRNKIYDLALRDGGTRTQSNSARKRR